MIIVRDLFVGGARRGWQWFTPGIVRLALWSALAGWTAWTGSHWARDALATAQPAPAPQTHTAVDLDAAVARAAAAPIFGKTAQSVAKQNAAPVALNVKLRGVFAGGGGPTGAVVNTGQDDEFIMLDRELSPGVVLKGVYSNHIMVSHDGVAERVELEPLKSEAPRSKGAGDAAGGRLPHGRIAHGRTEATEAAPSASNPVTEVETAPAAPDATPAAPLAPPMKNSQATPDALAGFRLASASPEPV